MQRLTVVAVGLVAACGNVQPKLYASGTEKDEGHGELARAATKFLTRDSAEDDLFVTSAQSRARREPSTYGGVGGDAYGGSTYATYVVPSWQYTSTNRTPRYAMQPNLTGAIEGTITWHGAAPAKVSSSCGPIDGPRIAADGAVADVLVYIEHVTVGRQVELENRPAFVGGVVQRTACGFSPMAQIVTPLPSSLTVHGDARRTRVRISAAAGTPRAFELQEAGRVGLQLSSPGLTKVDAEDGTSGAAWILGVDTPYYAITDDRGHFRIEELQNGTYDLTIWQAPIATVSGGVVTYGAPLVVHRTVKVDGTKPARLDVALSR